MSEIKTQIDFAIHSAVPRIGSAAQTVWMNVPLMAAQPYENLLTLFFASPAIAKSFGESLVREATKAERIAAIQAEEDAVAV